jgi:predicted O-methyltransferase YrrM
MPEITSDLLQKIETNLKLAGLDGWCNSWDISTLYKYVSEIPTDGIYLEIGVAKGASLAVVNYIFSTFSKNGYCGGLDVIDWKAERIDRINKFLELMGTKPSYSFIEEDSQLAARFWTKPIDVLYIDGDHTYIGVLKDIVSWIPHVKSGGVVLFDDYNDVTGVKQAINDTIKGHPAIVKEDGINQEMYYFIKK